MLRIGKRCTHCLTRMFIRSGFTFCAHCDGPPDPMSRGSDRDRGAAAQFRL